MKRKVYRKSRKTYKKRKYSKKRTGGARAVRVLKQLTPFAPRYITKQKYFENFILSPTAGSSSIYQFNLNSIYDPNESGTGHQPMGTDQLQPLYSKYRVYKAIMKVEVFTPAADMYVGIGAINNNTPMPADAEEFTERYGSTAKIAPGGGGFQRTVLRKLIRLPVLMGVSSIKYKTDDVYAANLNANPVERAIGFVFCQNYNTTAITTRFNCTITYFVEYYDPIALGKSV